MNPCVPGDRPDAFSEYLTTIGVVDGGTQPPDRTQTPEWSDDQLNKGAIEAAIHGVASLLSDFPPGTHEIDTDVWSTNRPVTFRDCRVYVVAGGNRDCVPPRLWTEVVDKSREALVLCVLPSVGLELVTLRAPVSLDVQSGVIPLYPSDIDALAFKTASLAQLIEYKFFRRILVERPDAETQFHDRFFSDYGCGVEPHRSIFIHIDNAIQMRGEYESDWLEHPYLVQLDGTLARSRHSLLFGYSSSGKSVLAFQAARRRANAGWFVRYINLSDDVPPFPSGLVQALLFGIPDQDGDSAEDEHTSQLHIVDDMQSRPALARLTLILASLTHRVREKSRPVLLGVSWKDANLIREPLLQKYADILEPEILKAIDLEVGDDIHLLRLTLEVSARQKKKASRDDVAVDVWQTRLPDDEKPILPKAARRVALLTAAIGQFDIHVPPGFVQRLANVEHRTLSKLIESRLLRRIGDRVTLGHRSLCALMASWLGKNGAWNELAEVGGPRDVASAVLAYLEAVDTAATIDTLRALVARAGFKERGTLNDRAAAVMELWRAFDAVVERVERQQASDPTWGNTPSSAVFVTVLLTRIGKSDLAIPSLKFLRNHWSIVDAQLCIDTSGLATVVDFNLLKDEMLREDDANKESAVVDPAVSIDIERFHRTWLSGLILGAEAASNSPSIELVQAVETTQLPNGAFYPRRVPWCTARVLLGLAACGRTVTTSKVVSRAVDWLLRDRSADGASSRGIWHPGSGEWNSDVEATALSLLAVVRAGVDPSDDRLKSARSFLLSMRKQWEGFEGAAAIEALLASGSKWHDLAADAARLSERTLDQSLWLRATLPASEILAQTCHVAQAATHLIEIGWAAIQADIKELLSALDLPTGESVVELNIQLAEEPTPLPPRLTTEGEAHKALELRDLVLSKYAVVGDYLRFDDRARSELVSRYAAIGRGIEHKSKSRENHLLWAPPGSGKTYFVTEVARELRARFEDLISKVINLSAVSHEEFTTELKMLAEIRGKPVLCMIDEIDGRTSESWPYEELFSCLDWNSAGDRHIVIVLAGSGGRGLNGMMRTITDQAKGADLLDRVPESNRFELPAAVEEDRLLVFAKQALLAAASKRQALSEIERLALFFVLKSENLTTLRQLTELAKFAVSQMDGGDSILRYDHLFRMGDRRRLDFWTGNLESVEELQGKCVPVGNDV